MDSNKLAQFSLPPVSTLALPQGGEVIVSEVSPLQQKRNELLEALTKSLTPDRVTAVLNAIYEASLGLMITVKRPDPMTGEAVDVQIRGKPDITAAKLYLQYAVGPAETLQVGQSGNPLLEVSPEDMVRLKAIAERFGHGLTNVRVVKPVSNKGGADVIETQAPQQIQESATPPSRSKGSGKGGSQPSQQKEA